MRDGRPLAALWAHAGALEGAARPAIAPVLQSVLWRLLAAALRTGRTSLDNIQLVDPRTGALGIVAQRGFGLEFLAHFRTVRAQDESACGRAMRSGAPVVIPDVTVDPQFETHRDIARTAGFHAVQSTPILFRGGSLLGMMSTRFRRPRRFTPEELQSPERHARLAAFVIDRRGRGPPGPARPLNGPAAQRTARTAARGPWISPWTRPASARRVRAFGDVHRATGSR